MGFALSRTIVYWGFDCAEDSIPFARSTPSLSSLPEFFLYQRNNRACSIGFRVVLPSLLPEVPAEHAPTVLPTGKDIRPTVRGVGDQYAAVPNITQIPVFFRIRRLGVFEKGLHHRGEILDSQMFKRVENMFTATAEMSLRQCASPEFPI